MTRTLLAICFGASLGALLRYALAQALNDLLPFLPLGTLAANLLGGLCMGLGLGFFSLFPSLGPEWRLLVFTGFLGALTTFSAYSAEVSLLLVDQRFGMAAGLVALHNIGSVLMTLLGLGGFTLLKGLVAAAQKAG
jgi:crcB protein